jgi:hypothetical protein
VNKVPFTRQAGDTGARLDMAALSDVARLAYPKPSFDDPAIRFAGGATTFTLATEAGKESFVLDGDFRGDQFKPPPERPATINQKDDQPCFAEGTHILTPDGETPVEQLRPGGRVILHDGSESEVVFVGHRQLDLSRHPRPELARPVRIPAGALEDDVPSRDLLLSPDHALFLNGALVPVKYLIDGLGVRQDRAINWVRYYHVELAEHGVLVAEGAPAESFPYPGHRAFFENADMLPASYPDIAQANRADASCAVLVTGGNELATIRTRLYARALMRGFSVTERQLICLKIGETLVPPAEFAGQRVTFRLPQGVRNVVLLSPVFIPAEFDPSSADRRALGIQLTELIVDGKFLDVERVFNPSDLHKRGLRDAAHWTRGATRLTLPPGSAELSFKVTGWPKVWRSA